MAAAYSCFCDPNRFINGDFSGELSATLNRTILTGLSVTYYVTAIRMLEGVLKNGQDTVKRRF